MLPAARVSAVKGFQSALEVIRRATRLMQT
jgi:hypothetical protein